MWLIVSIVMHAMSIFLSMFGSERNSVQQEHQQIIHVDPLYDQYTNEVLTAIGGLWFQPKDSDNEISCIIKLFDNDTPLLNRFGLVTYKFEKNNQQSMLDFSVSKYDMPLFSSCDPTKALTQFSPVSDPFLHRPIHDAVIVLTTCNQLPFTIHCLSYLKSSFALSDLVIVDDHSVDGTVEYLQRKGYFVIPSRVPQGLTASWNIGYEFAKLSGYKYVFFLNNDVLVPRGAVAEMRRDLLREILVVPTTTTAGAGHNPAQAVKFAHRLTDSKAEYSNNPAHVQTIQYSLSKRFARLSHVSRVQRSMWKGSVRFNGFFYGLNITGIETAIQPGPLNVFSTKNKMVGQEDDLTALLLSKGIVPKISLASFSYHYKSVTVKAARQQAMTLNLTTTTYVHNSIDLRENLSHYHPELRQRQFNESQLSNQTTIHSNHSKFISNAFPYDKYWSNNLLLPFAVKKILYPHKNESQSLLTIAFAISDAITNPGAGDIFTAHELGDSLLKHFPGRIGSIKYLMKGRDWYEVTLLRHVDLLITMLDDYNLSKALSLTSLDRWEIQEPKPSLVAIAWMRNWFQRWLTRPWLGNYDLILVSSLKALEFFRSFSVKYGFQSECINGCPQRYMPTLKVAGGSLSAPSNNRNVLSPLPLPFFRSVPVELLRIATSPNRFHPDTTTAKYQADYAFTGSYYNSPRNIMTFDPAHVGKWKGLIVGSGWENANVSQAWKDICIGKVPYDEIALVYQSATIAIDDANHVTAPWASVNSRVFDALASGTLVFTNGASGNSEVFDSMLPVYHTGSDLNHLLDYYLSNPQLRQFIVASLRSKVLKEHTYAVRARELNDIFIRLFELNLQETTPQIHHPTTTQGAELNEFEALKSNLRREKLKAKYHTGHTKNATITAESLNGTEELQSIFSIVDIAPPSPPVSLTMTNNPCLCMGIRTYEPHGRYLEIMIHSLAEQFSRASREVINASTISSPSQWSQSRGLRLFLVNTELSSPDYEASLNEIVDRINRQIGLNFVHIVRPIELSPRENPNSYFGYDSSDILLNVMLEQSDCEWIMLTNGDNIYNSAWFSTIQPYLRNAHAAVEGGLVEIDILGWDFVTHHVRSGSTSQVISVDIARGHVDLGSIAIRSRLFRYQQSVLGKRPVFLPDGFYTSELMARDYFALETLMKTCKMTKNSSSVKLIHQVLLFHQ